MIQIKNLTKQYVSKSKESVLAINNISCDLPSKGLVFLLGESGAGKSTLLNIIGGIERADSGQIIVDGVDIQNISQIKLDKFRNTDIGFIFQEFNLLDNFNVGENIMLAQNLQHQSQESKIEEVLAAVNMSTFSKRKINELSGGQKQRVAIARALIKNPKIILADEPTGALDAKTGRSILELLKEISRNSLVLVVSHDEGFANSFADRIIRLADGTIIEDKCLKETVAKDIEESVNVNEEQDRIPKTFKRYSLSPKAVVKMSTYSLKSKKIRLAITLLLCIVCFGLFGIADSLAAWDSVENTYTAIVNSEDKYLVNFADADYSLGDNYTLLYKKNQVGVLINERYLPIRENESSYGCYSKYADGYVEIDDMVADELGLKLYAGRYPEENGEIAISYHIYRSFKAGAYKTDDIYIDGSMIEPTNEENGILGKTITLDWENKFTVVGIIDSGYDYERNASIDPLSEEYNGYKSDVGDINPDGHSILYLHKGGIEYINSLMQMSDFDYGVPSHSSYEFEMPILNELVTSKKNTFVADFETFRKSNTSILWIGEEKTSLSDNEAIISYLDISSLLGNMTNIPGISSSIGREMNLTYVQNISGKLSLVSENFNSINSKLFKAYSLSKIYEYAVENAQLYKEDENISKIIQNYTNGDEDLAMAVAYYLSSIAISNDIESGYLDNPLGKSGLQIIAQANMSLINSYNIADKFNAIKIKLDDGSQIDAKIVGVYIPSEATGVTKKEFSSYPGEYYVDEENKAFVNMVAYEHDKAILESNHLDARVGIIKIDSQNQSDIVKAITEYFDNAYEGIYTSNSIMEQADFLKGTMDIMKKIFYYISLGIGIFASIMFANYLINSIMARKKEIGVLRAIGATSRDIFYIVLCEGAILFAIIFPISSILSGIAGLLINSMVSNELGILIPISVFGIRQILLILLVSFAVTLLVSLIGSYFVSKRKPIDIIR